MTLHRNTFFLLLFVLMDLPLPLYKLFWLARSTRTTGVMCFVGHSHIESPLGITSHPVIRFALGRDSVEFNGLDEFHLAINERVPVRYQKDNPYDAKIDLFISIWGDTLVYSLMPVFVFLVLYLSPGVIPWRARVQIGGRPFIKIT